MAQILIVDDEQPLLQSLSLELRRSGHECLLAETGNEALTLVSRHSPDLAILDVKLPDISGLELLRSLKSELPEVPVLVVTAFATVDSAVEAMKEGAVDYIEKPLDLEEVNLVVERELRNAQLQSDVEAFRRGSRSAVPHTPIIGDSAEMTQLRETIRQLARVSVDESHEQPHVLIVGETGTGKDLVARHLHRESPNADRPFVHINCSSLPRELVESELFGHEKGAFTHAQRKQGLFEIAQGGTIFLDEIGDMPLSTQAKLLTVLEHRHVRRVGGTRDYRVNARIIAATNADLPAAVEAGRFRADLFYRLRVVTLQIPPLRDRRDDLAPLIRFFLERFRSKYRKGALELDDAIGRQLSEWSWPGNVRELAHTIEQMVLLSRGQQLASPTIFGRPVATTTPSDPLRGGEPTKRFDFGRGDCRLETVERELILAALEHTQGNVSEVARLLGMSRGALRHRMAKWEIQP